jgi:hypothetical protein
VIYRSRQPIVVEGRSGFADFWTANELRARQEAAAAPGRLFETLSESDIAKLPPAAQLKARAAWAAAFPDQ